MLLEFGQHYPLTKVWTVSPKVRNNCPHDKDSFNLTATIARILAVKADNIK